MDIANFLIIFRLRRLHFLFLLCPILVFCKKQMLVVEVGLSFFCMRKMSINFHCYRAFAYVNIYFHQSYFDISK